MCVCDRHEEKDKEEQTHIFSKNIDKVEWHYTKAQSN